MKRIIKLLFCFFICLILVLYVKEKIINTGDILSYIIKVNDRNIKEDDVMLEVMNILSKNNTMNPFVILNNNEIDDVSSNDIEVLESKKENLPLVYLYSTHQTEEYQKLDNKLYNFTPNVVTATYILEELLEEKGINTIVEERNIKSVLNKRGWDYSYSYRISREYMEDTFKKYPSLMYFIDIHRDGVSSKSIVTANINGKSYAKIMFLLGKNRDNYEENLNIVKILEGELEKSYKGILRNTYFQKSYSYNQDFSSNTFLIEIGACQNTIDEVYNSMSALSVVLEKYIKGEI